MSEHNPTPQAIFDRLAASFQAEKAGTIKMTIQFVLSGENGGTWWARVADEKVTVGDGEVAPADLTLVADAADYVKIRLGQLDPMQAYETGKLKLKGRAACPWPSGCSSSSSARPNNQLAAWRKAPLLPILTALLVTLSLGLVSSHQHWARPRITPAL